MRMMTVMTPIVTRLNHAIRPPAISRAAMLARLSALLPRPQHAPGVLAAAATAGAAAAVAPQLPAHLHLSAIPLSLALGAFTANALPAHLTRPLAPGLAYASSTLLRSGIVCVGAKLSALQVLSLGWAAVPAAVCSVGAGVAVIPRLAAACGLAPRLGALLACGTSICGVTAISAVAPVVGATQAEVAIAVANVVAFGSCAMLLYPHVAAALFAPSDSQSIGLFFGLAVHDTAQVMGCAASYAEQYSDTAVVGAAAVAKLTRNVLLAAVVPLMSIRHASAVSKSSVAAAIPVFVVGFLGMAALRTAGDTQLARGGRALFIFDHSTWKNGADWLGVSLGTKTLLGTGLAAVGLSVNISAFQGAGLAPFIVGAAGASIVGTVGLVAALVASRVNPVQAK